LFVTIEKFDCDEQGGAVGDLNYSISFREHRNITVRKVSLETKTGKATVAKGAARTDNSVTPKTYTIARGDCLYNIAKKQLGNASKWPAIASLNGKKAPYTIHPGEVISLPV
ncbi:MAG: LysM peptidoglycan-binding domain-containing protein, partial [Bacteroides sp.]